MRTFYTADLHFGHRNIIGYCGRPYANVDEMNEALIDNWNLVVKPEDEVYVLGDVALGKIAETLPLVQRLNGDKFLVPGNHDRCWDGHSRVRDRDREMYEEVGFSILPSWWWYTLPLPDGDVERVRVSHMPYVGDSHDNDRYAEHRPVDSGHWLLHGHVHEKWVKNDRQVNVGVDAWDYKPVSANVLGAIITGRLIV